MLYLEKARNAEIMSLKASDGDLKSIWQDIARNYRLLAGSEGEARRQKGVLGPDPDAREAWLELVRGYGLLTSVHRKKCCGTAARMLACLTPVPRDRVC